VSGNLVDYNGGVSVVYVCGDLMDELSSFLSGALEQ
jgi:hypothetical protein